MKPLDQVREKQKNGIVKTRKLEPILRVLNFRSRISQVEYRGQSLRGQTRFT